MLAYLRSLLGRAYHPLNLIKVSASRLRDNYTYLSSLEMDFAIAPVLKSNAYGHGIVEVARILDPLHPPFFCVDSLFEAYELQKARIHTRILVMGYIHPESLAVKRMPFSFAVFTDEMLTAVKKYQPHAPIHIFVDTGMHREGVSVVKLSGFLSQAKATGLRIEGLMTHLAMADKPTDPKTRNQVEQFALAQKIMSDAGIHPRFVHAGASLALLGHGEYKGKIGNVGRGGLAVYGIDPEGNDTNLLPSLALYSTIVQIKELSKGQSVGYDYSFTAPRARKIALLPIGYNDGVDRRLSNNGVVYVQSVPCPIIGKVSMNMTVIDVTHTSGVTLHEPVEIFSSDSLHENSIASSAHVCRTIPYDLLIHMNPTTKRMVVSSRP